MREAAVAVGVLHQEDESAEELARDRLVACAEELAGYDLHVLELFLARLWGVWGGRGAPGSRDASYCLGAGYA